MTVNALPNCFYAIVTGNNQANLVAVFAMAQPGDHVIWLQTPTAVQRQWLKNSDAVLVPRGLTAQTVNLTEQDELSPFRLAESILSLCRENANRRPVFILNGGQKFTALGFQRVSDAIEPAPLALYADLGTATLLRLDASTASFHPISWGENPLTFEELLRFRGNRAGNATPDKRIWPNPPAVADPLATLRTNPTLQSLVLRIFSTCTVQRGDSDTDTAAIAEARLKLQGLPRFVSSQDANIERWSRIVTTHVYERLPADLRNLEGIQRLSTIQQPDSNFFRHTAGFFRTQALACLSGAGTVDVSPDEEIMLRNDGWIQGTVAGGVVQNETIAKRFGTTFEEAVAARLLRFLQDNPDDAASVREVWTGVEVCRDDGKPVPTPFQEYDVAILFESGRLVHLECKAGITVAQNALFSRLGAIRRTAGEGAEQVICGPLFGTPDDTHEEFVKLHQIQERVKDFGLKFLPYDAENGFEAGMRSLFDVNRRARSAVANASVSETAMQ